MTLLLIGFLYQRSDGKISNDGFGYSADAHVFQCQPTVGQAANMKNVQWHFHQLRISVPCEKKSGACVAPSGGHVFSPVVGLFTYKIIIIGINKERCYRKFAKFDQFSRYEV